MMKVQEFHLKKAQRNELFCEACKPQLLQYGEWTIVVLFYIAVHYVDAVLAKDTTLSADLRYPSDHWHRNRAILASALILPAAKEYAHLYEWSQRARYTRIGYDLAVATKVQDLWFQPLVQKLRERLQ